MNDNEYFLLSQNRILKVIRNVSKIINREKDPTILLKQTCHRLVETQGFNKVCIVLNSEYPSREFYFHSGTDTDSEKERDLLASGNIPKCSATAIKTRKLQIIDNHKNQCEGCSFYPTCTKSSVLSIPLFSGDCNFGWMMLSCPFPYPHGAEDHDLIKGLADDIAFALKTIKNERQLKKSQKLFNDVLDTVPEIVWLKDPEGVYLFCNNKLAQMVNSEKSQIIGATDYDIFPEKKADHYRKYDKEAIKSGETVINEESADYLHDGYSIWIETSKTPLFDNNGGLIGVLGVGRDISRRSQALKESEEKLAYLNLVVDNSPFPMWISSPTGTALRANHAHLNALNITANHIIGKYNLLQDDNFSNHEISEKLTSVLLEKKAVRFELFWNPEKVQNIDLSDSRDLYMDISIYPILDTENNIRHIIVQWIDITNIKENEKKIYKSKELLREAQEIAHIAHWTFDPSTGMPWWSDELYRIYGRDPAKGPLSYEEHPKLVHPDDWKRFDKIVNETAETGKPFDITLRILRTDGEIRYINSICKPILNESGSVIEMRGTIQDVTKIKLVEKDLRLNQEKTKLLADLVMNSNQPVAVRFTDGKLGRVNPAFCKLTGYTEKELSSINCSLDLTPVEWRPIENEILNKLVKTGIPTRYEKEYIRKDGSRVFVELFTHLALNDRGKADYFYSFITDITKSKQTELDREKLIFNMNERKKELSCLYRISESIRKHHELSDVINDILISIPKGFQYPDITMVEIYIDNDRYTSQDFKRSKWFLKSEIACSKKSCGSLTVFYMEDKASADEGPFLKEERYLIDGIARMLGETIELEIVNKERMMLTQAIEQADETIVITNKDAVIQYVNPAFEKNSGYKRNEVLGKKPNLLKSGKQNSDYYRQMWVTLSSGKTWSGRFVNKRKDGSLFTEEAVISPVLNKAGITINYVGVKRNISNELLLENQLKQAYKMEAIGRLAGGIAHDFNNMLGVILGHADIVLEQIDKGQNIYDNLKEIKKAGSRSADLTRQLLSFARKQTITPRIININETVSGMIKMLKRLIGEDIDLTWNPVKDLWPVRIDPTQIDQILANLCVNARDAISGVGSITIETDNITQKESNSNSLAYIIPGQYVMLKISDNGCGIASDIIENIFEPFFTTKGQGEGTGLGLSMVYGIIKQNNGYIDVESEPTKGTSIIMYLPKEKETAASEISQDKPSSTLSGSETILLVEDERGVLKLTKMILEGAGYTVLDSDSPTKAIGIFQEYGEMIHMLITDVIMPDMNGRELVQVLLKESPHLKHLFISGYTADIISQHGALNENVNFLEKPFSSKALTDKVREILDKDSL